MYTRSLGAVANTSRHSGRQYLRSGTVRIRYPGNSVKYRPLVQNSLKGLGCACRSQGLGDTAQVQSAAQYAALGAKIGSVVPGVGTVIGAAVGAIYGAIKGKKKPVRPSKQDIATCNSVVSDYEELIAPYPSQPIGGALPEDSLKAVWMCLEMVRGGTTKDPRFLEGNWLLAKDVAVEAVKKTFTTPAGTEIVLTTAGRKDIKGKAFRPAEVRWRNGEANSLQSIADKVREFFLRGCLTYNKAELCDKSQNDATWRHSVLDLVAWAAATQIPNVDLPSDPTAALPGAPIAEPKPVMVTNTAPMPILTATVPGASINLPGAISATPAPPGAPPGAYEAQLAAQLQPMLQSLLAQGADDKYAFTAALSSLSQRGIEPTAAVQTAVANEVQKIGGVNPWYIVGGGLAAAILIYALAGRRR